VCYGIGLMRPWGNSRLGSRVDHSRRPSSYTIALHILTVAASCATSLHAQDLPALTYSTEQGLTHDIVTRLVQDPRGFLWVGGTTDIARFDGEHFTTYGRAEGLDVGTAVNQLSFGPEGDLWIATNGAGVSRFNLTTTDRAKRFTQILVGEARASNRVNVLVFSPDRRLWAGTDAGLYVGHGPHAFQRVSLPDESGLAPDATQISSLAVNGRWLWVGTARGVYRCSLDRDGCEIELPRGTRQIGFLRNGQLWLERRSGIELWHIDAENGIAGDPTVLLKGLRPRRIVEASDGLTIVTEDRQVMWTDGRTERIVFTSSELQRLNDIAEDATGNLWLATDGGLVAIRRQGVSLFSAHRDLKPPLLRTLVRDPTGRPYAISHGDWLHVISGSDVRAAHVTLPPGISRSRWPDTAIRFDSRGNVWLGTGRGLFVFSRPAPNAAELAVVKSYTVADGLAGNHVSEIFEDSGGDVWIANVPVDQGTLTVWRRRLSRFERLGVEYGLPSSQLHGFIEDPRGIMWARLREGGFVRIGPEKATVFDLELGVRVLVSAMIFDRRGRLWIGRGDQLLRVDDPMKDRIHMTTVLTGLGGGVNSLAEDASGTIFIGTVGGLFSFNSTDHSLRRFSSFEGLPRGSVDAMFADSDGTILLVAGRTLARLASSRLPQRDAPRCLLSALRVSGRVLPMPVVGLDRVKDLDVQPGANQIDIEVLGLSPRLGEPLDYEYRLSGVSDVWTRAPERRITYAGLASGRYVFEARVVGATGASVSPVAAVAFRVLPPWYRRWWFLSLVGLTSLLAAYVAHRRRLAEVVRTERLRSRIATDLHDDIGSSLSQIAILAEVARRRAGSSDPAVAGPLDSIATTSRNLVDAMSDIVWAVNPRTDSLSDLTRRMHRFAEETLGGANITLTFSAPSTDGDLKLGADLRRELYLILKESVNNIARHSGATTAVVELGLTRSELHLSISDDGRGFDPAMRTDGNGVESMRKRAAAFGGVFTIDSAPGRGTRVSLTANLRRALG
jgi:signal transduction histidine kinase/ligand-binding sensor domain-containing protein